MSHQCAQIPSVEAEMIPQRGNVAQLRARVARKANPRLPDVREPRIRFGDLRRGGRMRYADARSRFVSLERTKESGRRSVCVPVGSDFALERRSDAA